MNFPPEMIYQACVKAIQNQDLNGFSLLKQANTLYIVSEVPRLFSDPSLSGFSFGGLLDVIKELVDTNLGAEADLILVRSLYHKLSVHMADGDIRQNDVEIFQDMIYKFTVERMMEQIMFALPAARENNFSNIDVILTQTLTILEDIKPGRSDNVEIIAKIIYKLKAITPFERLLSVVHKRAQNL